MGNLTRKCWADDNAGREKTTVQNDDYDYDQYDDDNSDDDDDNDDQGDSAPEATLDLQLQASERRTFPQVFCHSSIIIIVINIAITIVKSQTGGLCS